MPKLNGFPSAVYVSTTGFNAAAEIGCRRCPSTTGTWGFISSQVAFDTVIPLPLRSIENGVTM